MKQKKKAFTLVELLTVLAVMSLLIGILIPSLKMAQDAARTAKQKVNIVSIEQALLAFRNDNGDYPPLNVDPKLKRDDYEGAQQLAEALLGMDLLGCDKRTNWDGDLALYMGAGRDLTKRMPRYLELETANAFLLEDLSRGEGLFDVGLPVQLNLASYVLCDIFNRFDVTVGGKVYRAGTPILYYKANPFGIGLDLGSRSQSSNYNYFDNDAFANLGRNHWAEGDFYNFITDTRIVGPPGALPWPYKRDSYILISAGIDGIYGTRDDVTNFSNR